MNENPSYEILGIANPIIDLILPVTDEYVASLHGRKGGMEAVDHKTLNEIVAKSGSVPILEPGGSCSNVIRGLAHLGRKCAIAGKMGEDDAGRHFRDIISGIGITPLLVQSTTPTAQVVSLVTPDGQRTLRSFFGASQEMSAKDLQAEFFAGIRLVHIEGYSLFNDGLTEKSMEFAKAAGAKISFDLASFEVVELFKDRIYRLLHEYVDIVIGNADEIQALTGKEPKESCQELEGVCEIVVVLMGKHGCMIGNGKDVLKFAAYPVEPIDTTGAGDLFTSGFLHGYLGGKSLKVCAHYGALVGAAVVQIVGADIPESMWRDIRKKMGGEANIL